MFKTIDVYPRIIRVIYSLKIIIFCILSKNYKTLIRDLIKKYLPNNVSIDEIYNFLVFNFSPKII